jgi:5-methylcytosine-specific restriction protein B
LQQIIKYDILPTLQEYWFDDKEKYEKWVNSLSRVFND